MVRPDQESLDGPFIAAGAWELLPKWWLSEKAPVFTQDTFLLWNFTDDYLDCEGACEHRARYRLDDGSTSDWVWEPLDVITDATGKQYAYARVPAGSLDTGTYWFWFDVADCAGQRTYSKVHAFKVAH